MGELGLHFMFADAGSDPAEDAAEGAAGDGGSVANQRDFLGGLGHPQTVQQGGQPAVGMEGIPRLAIPDEPGVPGFHLHHRAFVFVRIQEHLLRLAHQLVKLDGEGGQPLDIADAGEFDGLLPSELVAFPGGQMGVGFAQEQDLPLLFLECLGHQQQDRFLLCDPREVEQVRVRLHSQHPVGVARQDVIGV